MERSLAYNDGSSQDEIKAEDLHLAVGMSIKDAIKN
ncbi:hypothetical protein BC749_102193 [Flavobacterium araucananum]|nr:hypothetical protein BC749_102193 [Flavobacterium araucananum]